MSTKLIIALDFDNIDAVKPLLKNLDDTVTYYKVGLELFVSSGPAVIDLLKNSGKKVFLDLKFHDIPNTASKAVAAAAKYGADIIDLHIQGGTQMMKASVEALDNECAKLNVKRPLLIGVTLLTSLDDTHLADFGITGYGAKDYVLKLASLAKSSGLDGIVSSALETEVVKKSLGNDFITVTPGIRLTEGVSADQKRIVTPADAKRLGTDYIVVGRPITQSSDPKKIAMIINKELGI